MSKHDILSLKEIEKHSINPLIFNLIEKIKFEFNITNNSELFILDWGCGRGRTVAKLKMLGYSAYGVEIDQKVIDKSKDVFDSFGKSLADNLKLIRVDNSTEFESNMFHLIISEHVIEHVENFEEFVIELERLIKTNGRCYHVFPSKFRFIEPHLYMPLVHLFPKNFLRKCLIYSLLKLNIEPNWDLNQKDKLETYYNYSINKTFYRSLRDLFTIFRKYGFESYVLTRKNVTFLNFFKARGISNNYFLSFFSFLVSNFHIAHIENYYSKKR
jgi:SAM-dependent methyltransferase